MSKDLDIVAVRHSLAHILAAATCRLFGDVKLGVGPAIENGFYYDMDLGDKRLSDDDLSSIQDEMKKIIAEKQDFSVSTQTIDAAEKWAIDHNQPYKLELIHDFKEHGTTLAGEHHGQASSDDIMTFYTNGEFTDLCRGGHVANTADIPADAFCLTKIAGAYFRGDETKPMMQRVYGVAFLTADELIAYLEAQSEAKKRDHRKLGRELSLYVTSDLVGAGLPMFTPRGTVLREEITNLSNRLRQQIGFEKVWVPHMTKKDLYEKSGHWAKFGDELFLVKSQETSDQLVLKPMNCPHHGRIYASEVRSYRDLPQRYLETTTVYRDEKSGELGGLSRVRSITQDDSHDFCRQDQIETEISNLLGAVRELYDIFDLKLRVRLSYRDETDAYLGPIELWESAQQQLKSAVQNMGDIEYYEQTGEAAFYGPKIDFMATDALGREHQLATAQLDFVQPERFALEYIAQDGSIQRPVMIHCALLGSVERFLSVYIEHTAGKFPVWVAPEQLRIIKVNDSSDVTKMTKELVAAARDRDIRYRVDDINNSIGKKIRNAELLKVPYIVIVGEREAKSGTVSVRVRRDLLGGAEQPSGQYSPKELMETIAKEHDNHSRQTTFQ